MKPGMQRVTWKDADGKRQSRDFLKRPQAILFVNHLVLDLGVSYVRVRKVYRGLERRSGNDTTR